MERRRRTKRRRRRREEEEEEEEEEKKKKKKKKRKKKKKPITENLVPQWLLCHMSEDMGSVLRLVGPVSVHFYLLHRLMVQPIK